MKVSSIGVNVPRKQQVKNVNFKSAVPLKTSEFKKMVDTYRLVSVFKYLAKESKNIFDIDKIVSKTYKKPVISESKEYLKKSFFEDPVLFMSLAKSKYNKKNRNYTVDYSPEEIYGIIITKKEDPERAYKLAKLLQNSADKGHLDDLEEVFYLADKLKTVEYTPRKSVNSKGFYYRLKSIDMNPKLFEKLSEAFDTDLEPLTYKDIFEIVQLEKENPEFINKMTQLTKIDLEDLYILEDFYNEKEHKEKIDELVDFITTNTKDRYSNPILFTHSSTASVLNLLSVYEKYPNAVKTLMEKFVVYTDIEELAEYHDKASYLTEKTYKAYISKSKNDNGQLYFKTMSDVKNFLASAVEVKDIFSVYKKAYGKANLQKKIELVNACGDKENLGSMCKILNSKKMPKDFDIKNKMPKLIEYVKANSDKEITKEMFEYAFDPIAKDFGLV